LLDDMAGFRPACVPVCRVLVNSMITMCVVTRTRLKREREREIFTYK